MRSSIGLVSASVLLGAATLFADPPQKIPLITSSAGTTFTAGQAATFAITTAGVPAPSLVASGVLPSGVTFTEGRNTQRGTASLSGTGSYGASALYAFSITATNPHGTATQVFRLRICSAISVIVPSAIATEGVLFSDSFTQSGAKMPATFVQSSGTLPPGLTMAPDGLVSGTPSSAGTYTSTIRVIDAVGCEGSAVWTVRVRPPAPFANDDRFETPDGIFNAGLFANDSTRLAALRSYGAVTGLEQTTIGAASATENGGTVSVNADGTFEYRHPPVSAISSDRFRYVLANESGVSTATVNLSVFPHSCGAYPVSVAIIGPERPAGSLPFDPYAFSAQATTADNDPTVCPARFAQSFTYSWSVGSATATGPKFTFAPTTSGDHQIQVVASGSTAMGAGAYSLRVSCSDPRPQVAVAISNVSDPQGFLSPGTEFHRDARVTVTAAASSQCLSNGIFTFAWTVNGDPNGTGPTSTFVATQPAASYGVSVVVRDTAGNETTAASEFSSSSCGANPTSVSIIGPERPAGSLAFDPYSFSAVAANTDNDGTVCPTRFAQTFTYSWRVLNTTATGQNFTFAPATSGDYSIELVAAGSSSSGNATRALIVSCADPRPRVETSISNVSDPEGYVSSNGAIHRDAEVTVAASASAACLSNPLFTYAWTLNGVPNGTNVNSSFVVTQPSASYAMSVVVRDRLGNESSASSNVSSSSCGTNRISVAIVDSRPSGTLPFDPYLLTAIATSHDDDISTCPSRFAQAPYSYSWSVTGANANASTGASIALQATASGSVGVTVQAQSSNGASTASASRVFAVDCHSANPILTSPRIANVVDPEGYLKPGEFFAGDRVTVDVAASSPCLTNNRFTYAWMLNGTPVGSGPSVAFDVTAPASSYALAVTVRDDLGYQATSTSDFTASLCGAHPISVRISMASPAKPMDARLLTAVGSPPLENAPGGSLDNDPSVCPSRFATHFSWTVSGAGVISNANAPATTFTPTAFGSANVGLVVSNSSLSASTSLAINSICNSGPAIGGPILITSLNDLPYDGQQIDLGDRLSLSAPLASSTCKTNGALLYAWTLSGPGALSSASVPNPSFSPPNPSTSYAVQVTVIDALSSVLTSTSASVSFSTSACGAAAPVVQRTPLMQNVTAMVMRPGGVSELRSFDLSAPSGGEPAATIDGQTYAIPFYLLSPITSTYLIESACRATTVSSGFISLPGGSNSVLHGAQGGLPNGASFPVWFAPDRGDRVLGSGAVIRAIYEFGIGVHYAAGSTITMPTTSVHVGGRCGANTPVADFVAAPAVVGEPVNLNGTISTDADNTLLVLNADGTTSGCGLTQDLMYQWTIRRPDGSELHLTDGLNTFTPLVSGTYNITLTVTDSTNRVATRAQTITIQ